jgi:chitin-binding protein
MDVKVGVNRKLLGGLSSAAVIGVMLLPQQAQAHGYASEPPSRAYACRLGLNRDCGGAQYEPHSVGETDKGFPGRGPVDGKIASGGIGSFAALDVQAANRWHLTEIKDRNVQFAWQYTAGHNTTGWEYFITKTGWNPNEPLSRAAFELTPFCTVDGGGVPPLAGAEGSSGPGREKHSCTLPADRNGQHVILGVWTIDNTPAAFYNVMDVNIVNDGGPGEPAPGWSEVGTIQPHRELQVGDKVKARAFVGGVENAQYSAQISIDTADEGQPQNWSLKLAQRINNTQSLVKAGVRDSEGNIAPIQGANTIYAQPASGISSYELAYDVAPGDDAYLHIHGLKPDYALVEGKATIDFSVMTNKKLQVSATLFDAANQQVGFASQEVNATTAPLSLDATASAGRHLLKLVGISKQGRIALQEERYVELKASDAGGEYDHVYPEGMSTYSAGTRVLQPKSGEIFECKPFPFEGWCRIYSPSANQYEPSAGSNWQDAWIKR